MTMLTVIETPIGRLTGRAHIAERVRAAWPAQPPALHACLTAALGNPYATADGLLWLADALAEAATEAGAAGELMAQTGLTALRHLMQDAAPDRADVRRDSPRGFPG